jgi:hypothetical protein
MRQVAAREQVRELAASFRRGGQPAEHGRGGTPSEPVHLFLRSRI